MIPVKGTNWQILFCLSLAMPSMAQEKTIPGEARVVQVFFTPEYQPPVPAADTLYYSPSRMLDWTDFTGLPHHPSRDVAVSYTSFGYIGHSLRHQDTAKVYLTLQVFFVRSASWVFPGSENPAALAHEQLHFDITQLSALHFQAMVQEDTLLAGDYNSRIQYLFLDGFRYMDSLQERYDEQTQHGTDGFEQERWKEKIMKSLGSGPRPALTH